jgi:zinc transporter
VRSHALHSTDRLRQAAREGLRARSGLELFTHVLRFQADAVETMRRAMSAQVERAEDELLGERWLAPREALLRVRRSCAHLGRHFEPQRHALRRLLGSDSALLAPSDRESLAEIAEDIAREVEEAAGLYERAKLIQEELADRLAESTNRILFVLTMISGVFMPMTLVTGIWGMNVAGLPGLKDESAFWWVMALIAATGLGTLTALIAARRR